MTALLIISIIVAILVIIALLRFGVAIEYSESGFTARILAGFLSIGIYPPKKEKIKKVKPKKEPLLKKPGSLKEILELLPPIKNTLSRIRRKLLIKRLQIHFTAAGADPSNAAIAYGAVNAALCIILPVLEDNFKIRRRDIRTSADFESEQQKIYLNAAVSIAVWEALYVVFAILPLFSAMRPPQNEQKSVTKSLKSRKEVQDNG